MTPAIGYAIREQNRDILSDPAINAVEITFERADDPLRTDRYIRDLDTEYVSLHALKLSVGTPDQPGGEYIETLKQVAEENGAASISDHLGFTRDAHDGVEMGHFALMPLTEEALDVVCRNVDFLVEYYSPMHFFLENIAYLKLFEGTMSEAEFIRRMLANTECGWLLDVTNVYANATNFKFNGYDFIEEIMPHAKRVQMHLAGGFWDDSAGPNGMYIDSHSHPIPDEVFDLYRFALEKGHGKVDAVFIERDQNWPDEAGWRAEARKIRDIAEEVSAQMAS